PQRRFLVARARSHARPDAARAAVRAFASPNDVARCLQKPIVNLKEPARHPDASGVILADEDGRSARERGSDLRRRLEVSRVAQEENWSNVAEEVRQAGETFLHAGRRE